MNRQLLNACINPWSDIHVFLKIILHLYLHTHTNKITKLHSKAVFQKASLYSFNVGINYNQKCSFIGKIFLDVTWKICLVSITWNSHPGLSIAMDFISTRIHPFKLFDLELVLLWLLIKGKIYWMFLVCFACPNISCYLTWPL